jgi:methyl acetate hydrolase
LLFFPLFFSPLSIDDISFNPFPTQIDMAQAPTDPSQPNTFVRPTPMSSKHRYGGAGLHGSPSSYLKIVRAILRGGALEDEGSRILKSETVDLMFEPQLNEVQATALRTAEVRGPEPFTRALGVSLEDANYGLGGMLTGTGLGSGRGAKALHWSGMAVRLFLRFCRRVVLTLSPFSQNTFWVVDRANDVAFVVFSNITPCTRFLPHLLPLLSTLSFSR